MRNSSLRTKLLSSHLLPVGVMLLALAGAVTGFFQLGRSVDRILKDNYKSVVAAQTMKETLERQDSAATFFLAGQAAKARQQYEANRPRFEAAYAIEANNITERGERQIADDIGREFAMYRHGMDQMLYAPPSPQSRAFYFATLEPSFQRLKQRAQDVLDLNQAAIVRANDRAKREARRDVFIGVAATAATGLLAALMALRQIGAIMTPLVTLTRQAEEIGAGRLNQRTDDRRADEIGQLARTFNTMAERLSEARRAEAERLLRAERMSDAALESLYDPVIVTDAAGRVVHLNRAAERLFGEDSAARGRPARDVVREDRLARAIERAVGQEQTSAEEGEASLITFGEPGKIARADEADGQRTYRLRASPMRDSSGSEGSDGTLLGAVAVLEDVTHLTELDRLKTEFIGVASHELRTPVTSMLLGIELLQEGAIGALTEAQQEVVNATRGDLQRLERMMRDLLDLTRLEAGAAVPRLEIVPADEVLSSAAASVRAQAEAKGVLLKVENDAPLPRLRADRGQITRVLINLLNNAVRHTPKAGTVSLKAIGESESGHKAATVRFTVSDTGTGIPPDYLQQVFERFVQVPGATRGGAGLGLSISQAIVRAHGGNIKADSRLGGGSAFTFAIPVATGNSALAVEQEQES